MFITELASMPVWQHYRIALSLALMCRSLYAQTALADTFALPASMAASAPNLRTLLLSGDFFLGGVVAGSPVPAANLKLYMRQCVLLPFGCPGLGGSLPWELFFMGRRSSSRQVLTAFTGVCLRVIH